MNNFNNENEQILNLSIDTKVWVGNTIEEVKNKETPRKFHNSRHNYKEEKFDLLYRARMILSKMGTMEERRIVKKQLKVMERNKD